CPSRNNSLFFGNPTFYHLFSLEEALFQILFSLFLHYIMYLLAGSCMRQTVDYPEPPRLLISRQHRMIGAEIRQLGYSQAFVPGNDISHYRLTSGLVRYRRDDG